MSKNEIDRASVMRQIQARRLSKVKAARLLGISERHLYRLYQRFEAEGDMGLVSKKRGKRSNRARDEAFREVV